MRAQRTDRGCRRRALGREGRESGSPSFIFRFTPRCVGQLEIDGWALVPQSQLFAARVLFPDMPDSRPTERLVVGGVVGPWQRLAAWRRLPAAAPAASRLRRSAPGCGGGRGALRPFGIKGVANFLYPAAPPVRCGGGRSRRTVTERGSARCRRMCSAVRVNRSFAVSPEAPRSPPSADRSKQSIRDLPQSPSRVRSPRR
jgi:hypothetical protein